MHVEATRGQFHISSDPAQIDVRACHDLLRATYWASHRTPEQVEAALQGSLVVGLFDGERQIGMARAVTDGVTFSWICDVVVENAYRGRGLGSWLIESLLAHPRVAPTRAVLVTKDAQSFYRRHGFEPHPYDCLRAARTATWLTARAPAT